MVEEGQQVVLQGRETVHVARKPLVTVDGFWVTWCGRMGRPGPVPSYAWRRCRKCVVARAEGGA